MVLKIYIFGLFVTALSQDVKHKRSIIDDFIGTHLSNSTVSTTEATTSTTSTTRTTPTQKVMKKKPINYKKFKGVNVELKIVSLKNHSKLKHKQRYFYSHATMERVNVFHIIFVEMTRLM